MCCSARRRGRSRREVTRLAAAVFNPIVLKPLDRRHETDLHRPLKHVLRLQVGSVDQLCRALGGRASVDIDAAPEDGSLHSDQPQLDAVSAGVKVRFLSGEDVVSDKRVGDLI